ncbi:MAG: vWA domain-containing protein [bacterium]
MKKMIIWENTLANGEVTRYFEYQVPRNNYIRIVTLLFDTSDSCWPRYKPKYHHLIKKVVDCLQPHDQCELWLLGKSVTATKTQPILRRDEASRRHMANELLSGLALYRGGTWLRKSINYIKNDTAKLRNQENRFLIVVTDGEIFDREAVPQPNLKLQRIMVLYVGASIPQHNLWPAVSSIWHKHIDTPEIEKFLSHSPVTSLFYFGDDKSRALYQVCQDNSLMYCKCKTVEVSLGDKAMFCAVGGNSEFRPQLLFQTEGEEMSIPIEYEIRSGKRCEEKIYEQLEWLHPIWNMELLNTIVRMLQNNIISSEINEIHCPHCASSIKVEEIIHKNMIYCDKLGCSALLLLNGKVTRKILDKDLILQFPLTEDNKIVGSPEFIKDIPHTKKTYDIYQKEGKSYLVIRLKDTSFC